MEFKQLLKPGKIGTMELKNRMVQPAMGTTYTDAQGYVTDALVDYYSRRAEGGVGLIITEICTPDANGRTIEGELQIKNNTYIHGLRRLVNAAHAGGAKICIQFAHGGCFSDAGITGVQSVSPSGVSTFQLDWQESRAMTKDDIRQLVSDFGEAAARAKMAGFDAIEIHGGHGFLPLQFLSPYTNRRTDEYGGSLENRARFPLELVREIRKIVGAGFPLIYRLSGEEYTIPEGLTIEDACEFARMLEKEGVDAVHVTAGTWDSRYEYLEGIKNGTLNPDDYDTSNGVAQGVWIPPYFTPRGILVPLAEKVKKHVTIPVIAVNSISPEIGEQVLQDGKADFIAIGRQSIADPDYPKKVAQGRADDIRRCLRCNECLSSLIAPFGVQCSVNPEVGKERELYNKIYPAKIKKKVAVIGSGPAGLQAALIADSRGHEVTIFEKENRMGGALYYAAIPSFKSDFKAYLNYLIGQIEKSGVQVVMNTTATVETIKNGGFNGVIVATGAKPFIPAFCESDSVHDPLAVLDGAVPDGTHMIICGAGLVGCEVALYLAELGKKVTMIDMAEVPGPESAFYLKHSLWAKLLEMHVEEKMNHKIIHMEDKKVTCEWGGETVEYCGDAVICAVGLRRENQLLEQLQEQCPGIEIIPAGDVNQPRKVLQAVFEGYHAGRRI